ncbi:peroxiredoxin [Hoeflea prorocentri]|uniref:Glutathione-dependent peroxiredoxin n=1 Tax=Hoeflea prorocentri TaxID=1922333 RepID=A0A9X3UJ73_9HYPH|nr:peroxiredoxin [Hoeflea prorocentri]MCY6381654.1 peroxiredoxin [Hoeflea prorocentri]MDA5399454.1 peroxiredoxin [Hoeflea prorocentri]
MTISVGDKLPEIAIKEATSDGMNEVSTGDIFSGKKVVLFAVPGAFTGTCSTVHVPGYLQNRDALLAKGVDEIAVLSVNDGFVMDAWAKATGGEGKIRFLADWDGAFTKAVGQDIDLSAGTLGVRSKRYAMIVEDGTVSALYVEPSPGEVTTSGAEAILDNL